MEILTTGREQNLPQYGFGIIVNQKQLNAINNSSNNNGGSTVSLGGELLATFTPPQIANGNLEIIDVPIGVLVSKQYGKSIKTAINTTNVLIEFAVLRDGFMQVSITNHTGGTLILPAITVGAVPLT